MSVNWGLLTQSTYKGCEAGKWYFYDNGIRNVGVLWEKYIVGERGKLKFNEGLHKEFFFWRIYNMQEIDLTEERVESVETLEFR